MLAALSSLALPGVVIPSISGVSSGGRVVGLATSWSGVLCSVIIDFFSFVCLFAFFSSLVINAYLTYCRVGNMCPCQLSVSGFEGNLFALSRTGRPTIAALALMGLPSLTTNLCFVSGNLVLLINMFSDVISRCMMIIYLVVVFEK